MACENNAVLLHGYFDGELDPVRSGEFEEHLQACPECARALREQRSLRQALRSADLYRRVPDEFRARLLAALPQNSRPAVAPLPIAIRRRPVLPWLGVAAAALLAFLIGWNLFPRGVSQQALLAQEIAASHIRSLQPGHLYDVESTDQHTVKPWFDGKLDFAPPVQDMANAGFPLVGGRLDYLNGRAVAALVYRRQKHIINVFVWPEPTSEATALARAPADQTIQGYNLIFWRRDGMAWCAVSDLNNTELHQLATLRP